MTLLDGGRKKDFICPRSPPLSLGRNRIPNPLSPTAMKFPISSGLAAALCVALASCYPYPENQQQKKTTQAPQKLTAEQEKLKQEEDLKKKQEEELKNAQQTPGDTTQTTPNNTAPPQNNTPPPVEPKRTDYAFANKVPGKEGFVFSPYNNKVVDVRDIPSGTLVQDPTYPASEKKYFRVP